MTRIIDLAGRRFGRWTVLSQAKRSKSGTLWLCRCDCGAEQTVLANSLRRGTSKSCGCAKGALITERKTRHGQAGTNVYRIYGLIRHRCTNPSCQAWKRYGGAGVECRFESFEHFISVMGPRPSLDHSVDRYPNRRGHYEPGNVRWATARQQQRNRTNNHELTWQGRTQCIAAWAEELGLGRTTIPKRLKRGWSVERALSTP